MIIDACEGQGLNHTHQKLTYSLLLSLLLLFCLSVFFFFFSFCVLLLFVCFALFYFFCLAVNLYKQYAAKILIITRNTYLAITLACVAAGQRARKYSPGLERLPCRQNNLRETQFGNGSQVKPGRSGLRTGWVTNRELIVVKVHTLFFLFFFFFAYCVVSLSSGVAEIGA